MESLRAGLLPAADGHRSQVTSTQVARLALLIAAVWVLFVGFRNQKRLELNLDLLSCRVSLWQRAAAY